MGVGDLHSHVAGGFCCFAVRQGKRAIVVATASMEEKYEIVNRRGATIHVFVQDGTEYASTGPLAVSGKTSRSFSRVHVS